jgi:D-alanyl-lipoteichoic acid acyltransferase DltB (MBOAT superfamily)
MFACAGGALAYLYKERPDRRTAALCGVTLVFWAWVDLRSLAVLIGIAVWVRWITAHLERASDVAQRRRLQRLGVGVVILLLLGWRAVPDVFEALDQLGMVHVWRTSLWQPLGAAILAIQAVSVIVDVARRDSEAPSFNEAVLLCGFFPRALAGPVVRSGKSLRELRQEWDGVVPVERVAVLIMSAAVKKYVFAETLITHSAQVTAVRATEGRLDLIASMLSGVLSYVCDLSAYTDLAIAAGLVCGVTLPENFNAPFSGWTVGEFMRRWHMSISGFFRDYVMIPLRGHNRSSWRLFFAVCATFELIALWHSASPTTMLWGVLVGVPVACEAVLSKRRSERREPRRAVPAGWRRWACAVLVTLYYALASIPFPPDNISVVLRIYRNNFGHAWAATHVTTWWVVCVICLAWLTGAGLFAWLARRVEALLQAMPAVVSGVVVALVVSFTAGLAGGGIPTFLYQRL